ncbi:MAG: DUF4856 domain-containing protein [Bacteroidota bacterium]
MKNKFIKTGLFLMMSSLLIVGCKKKEVEPTEEVPTPTTYTVPSTYNFVSIDTVDSKQKIAMLAELTTYIKTTHSATDAPILDAQKLKDMFANIGGYFSSVELNGGGSLKSKCEAGFQADLESNFNGIVAASTNAATNATTTTASDGVSGKMISGTRYILVDTAGIEYKEFAEKGLMNAVFYYQASTILNSISTLDNTTKTNGTTAQERAWDQAFAYFGVPVTFPTVVTGLKNWGSYCNSVSNSLAGNTSNEATSLNATIMKAWITGRAAISNGDDATRNSAITSVLRNWEKVIAGRFITYCKGALANVTAPATYHHNLSEALGFIKAFQFNSNKTISDTDIETLMNYFKTNNSVNLYKVTTTNVNNAISKMAFIFNLDASKL